MTRRSSALAWLEIAGPVVVVAVLFALVLAGRFHTYSGNATGFVLFGRRFVPYTHPPRGAVIRSPFGYDGQFFYLQAKDPLVLHDSTLAGFRGVGQAFRMQRVAYPALAYIAAAGQTSAIPWSLLIVNVLIVLSVTAGFAIYARRRGRSGWWALAVGLMAGFMTGTLRDLSDPLAVASMLGAMMMWHERRRWWAASLLAVAVLAREPMALAVVAVAIAAAVEAWRGRRQPGEPARVLRDAWPVVAVPAAAFVIWHAYIDARYGGNLASSSLAFLPPFQGLIDEARNALSDPSRRNAAWEIAYLVLMTGGIAATVALVWRRVTAGGLAALLFGLSLLVLVFGDPWSYTRLSAPMFAVLALEGLERRGWPALALCGATAALTVAAPLAPWLTAV